MSKSSIIFYDSGRWKTSKHHLLRETPCHFDNSPEALKGASEAIVKVLEFNDKRDEGIFSDEFIRNEVKRFRKTKH